MIRFKQYLYLITAFVSVFLSGGYAEAAIRHGEYISPHRWLITAFCAVFFIYQSGAFAKTRSTGWTTEVPTRTGWYVVRELMHNEGAEWYRLTLFKLEREMFKLMIATDGYYSKRPFKPAHGAEYLRLEGCDDRFEI